MGILVEISRDNNCYVKVHGGQGYKVKNETGDDLGFCNVV